MVHAEVGSRLEAVASLMNDPGSGLKQRWRILRNEKAMPGKSDGQCSIEVNAAKDLGTVAGIRYVRRDTAPRSGLAVRRRGRQENQSHVDGSNKRSGVNMES